MSTIDYIVLFGYFISITAFGLWMARKTKTSDAYFRGERKFKWYIMIGHYLVPVEEHAYHSILLAYCAFLQTE
jgi:Na+/proline symporter